MKYLKQIIIILILIYVKLGIADINHITNVAHPNLEYINDIDNSFATKKALFREIMSLGYERVLGIVNRQSLKPNTWGVIFALDGTLIDEKTLLPNPGTQILTCKIKQHGGNVVIVSQRYNSNPQEKYFIENMVDKLKKQGFCFDSIVFANYERDTNKNPRFVAIISGDYENITTSKIMPGFKVIAYFGSKITDFPNLKENLAEQLPVTDNMYKDFGQQYFILPQ